MQNVLGLGLGRNVESLLVLFPVAGASIQVKPRTTPVISNIYAATKTEDRRIIGRRA